MPSPRVAMPRTCAENQSNVASRVNAGLSPPSMRSANSK